MKTAEEIQKRVNEGYTMSLYGTRENIHSQVLADIITLLELQPKFTPVSEGLPENDGEYQVTLPNKKVIQIAFIGNEWQSMSTIQAWQPLPKPYKP